MTYRTGLFLALVTALELMATPLPDPEKVIAPKRVETTRDTRQFLVPFSVELTDDEWHETMKTDLKRHGVLDQIVDQVPPYVVNVDYADLNCVHLGHPLTPTQTRFRPESVNYPTESAGGLFTLVAFDPDMPNRNGSVHSEFLHWLVVNIPDEEVERGDVLADYVGPLPAEGGGWHRIVFLVYRQPERIRPEAVSRAGSCDWASRARFNAKQFARLHGLARPRAINYFVTRFDSSVPTAIERCVPRRKTHRPF